MATIPAVRLVAISGSLRRLSKNGSLLEAAMRVAPPGVEIEIYRGLADLPPFNPDVEAAGAPASVRAFQDILRGSHAVLIASPEYAHGVPGALKNALDWVVASNELTNKPVGVLNASTRSRHAWTSLVETLTTMSARVIVEASIVVPLDGPMVDADDIVGRSDLTTSLMSAVEALVSAANGALSLRY